MADIINLRMARKARSRADAAAKADANRAAFGRSKEEKSRARAETARQEKALDGAKRTRD